MAAALPSPPASAASPSTSFGGIPTGSSTLPIPRRHPLRPGTQKEISLISYLDDKILRISRRYGKKFSNSETDNDDTPGYVSYEQVIQDVDALVDIVWISGTPSLQVPYLLSLAGILCSYLPAFAFSTASFPILKKLDQAFLTLLENKTPASSKEPQTSVVSQTEKVRIKSLVEDTRVVIVNVASGSGHEGSAQDLSDDDDDDDEDSETEEEDEVDSTDATNNDYVSQALARVYKKTLEVLGDALT